MVKIKPHLMNPKRFYLVGVPFERDLSHRTALQRANERNLCARVEEGVKDLIENDS